MEKANEGKFVIKARQRVLWDIVLFIAIVISAFIIPFEVFVISQSESFPKLDIIHTVVWWLFIADIFLNCFTVSEISYSGFWGWRNIIGLFYYPISTKCRREKYGASNIPRKMSQKEILLSYITSGWFLVDFLSIFPFDAFIGSLAFLNMSRSFRLLQLPRLLRGIKILKLMKSNILLKNAFSLHPAYYRFILIFVTSVWLLFVHGCLLYFFESNQKNITSFSNALDASFQAFCMSGIPETSTPEGYAIGVSSMLWGLIFFGILIGNITSLFEKVIPNNETYDALYSEWKDLFEAYPDVIFKPQLRGSIKQHIKKVSVENDYTKRHYNLIESLPTNVKDQVHNALSNAKSANSSHSLKQLITLIENKRSQDVIQDEAA